MKPSAGCARARATNGPASVNAAGGRQPVSVIPTSACRSPATSGRAAGRARLGAGSAALDVDQSAGQADDRVAAVDEVARAAARATSQRITPLPNARQVLRRAGSTVAARGRFVVSEAGRKPADVVAEA